MSTKRIVITGSSRGLGRALGHEFARRGHAVWLNGRDPERLEATRQTLASEHGDRIAGATVADVVEPDQVEALWREAVASLGGVDVWINNAGVATPRVAPALDMTLDELRRPLEVNLLGSLNCLHIVGRHMREGEGGTLYVLEGFGSDHKRTQLGLSTYGASKSGLSYLARSLREELADGPVRVGRISPGMVVTDMLLGPYAGQELPADVRRVFGLLADRAETVTPFIADGVEAGRLDIVWLTTAKLLGRLVTAPFRKRTVLEVE